jgi:DNA-binding beta-propeller fold protein YncE
VVANVPDIGGADQVNYNKKNNQYYIAARAMKGGPVLGVIDAGTNKLVQKIATTGGTPHSVASNEADGHVFLPVGSGDGGCSCIQVFALAP